MRKLRPLAKYNPECFQRVSIVEQACVMRGRKLWLVARRNSNARLHVLKLQQGFACPQKPERICSSKMSLWKHVQNVKINILRGFHSMSANWSSSFIQNKWGDKNAAICQIWRKENDCDFANCEYFPPYFRGIFVLQLLSFSPWKSLWNLFYGSNWMK